MYINYICMCFILFPTQWHNARKVTELHCTMVFSQELGILRSHGMMELILNPTVHMYVTAIPHPICTWPIMTVCNICIAHNNSLRIERMYVMLLSINCSTVGTYVCTLRFA